MINFSWWVHYAAAVSAMGQTKRVPQFMKNRFFNSCHEEIGVWRVVIKLGIKPMSWNKRASPFHLGHTVDIFEYGHKQIQVSHGHKSQAILRAAFNQIFNDPCWIVLASSFIVGIFGTFNAEGNGTFNPALCLNAVCNVVKNVFFNKTNGTNGYTIWQSEL